MDAGGRVTQGAVTDGCARTALSHGRLYDQNESVSLNLGRNLPDINLYEYFTDDDIASIGDSLHITIGNYDDSLFNLAVENGKNGVRVD